MTFWLEQEGRGQLPTKQKLQLAYKLRLLCATPWYLTSVLAKGTHWLHSALSSEQRVMLTAAVHDRASWDKMSTTGAGGLQTMLFGGEAAPQVSWSKQRRPVSSIAEAKMMVECTVGELWDKRVTGTVLSPAYFYNGTVWTMYAEFKRPAAAASADAEAPVSFRLSSYIQHGIVGQPTAFSLSLVVVGADQRSSIAKRLDNVVLCPLLPSYGFPDMCGSAYDSLEDATTKLAPFIHPDGKLHIQGTVTAVG